MDVVFVIAIWCLFIMLVIFFINFMLKKYEIEEFKRDSVGKSHNELVVKLGIHSDREVLSDNGATQIIYWKKYCPEKTQMILVGKIFVPIYYPEHYYGWKAVMRNDLCISMEEIDC